jgi:hypothetical protein
VAIGALACVSTVSAAIPDVVSVSPPSGAGSNQTFTFVVTDADGWQDMSRFDIVFNFAGIGVNACYFTYHRVPNTIYLVADSGNGNQYSTLPVGGSVPSVQNSQCILYSAGTIGGWVGYADHPDGENQFQAGVLGASRGLPWCDR